MFESHFGFHFPTWKVSEYEGCPRLSEKPTNKYDLPKIATIREWNPTYEEKEEAHTAKVKQAVFSSS